MLDSEQVPDSRDTSCESYGKGESDVMPSYLERYRQGECEQVWAELLALSSQIRDHDLHAEALSVAQETMSRARANIELLVPRLACLGYQFAYPDRVFVPADDEIRRLVALVERRAGPLPLSLRVWCDVVGEVNFMGSHPKLSTYLKFPRGEELGQGYLSLFAKHGGTAITTGSALQEGVLLGQRLLNELIQGMKSGQPYSPDLKAGVEASKEFLEGFQRPGAAAGPDVESDPLVVEPYFGDVEDGMDDSDNEEADLAWRDEAEPHDAILAPDPIHKTGQSGGEPYCIRFPDAAIDAPLYGEEDYGTFIEYLRICFRWGGFPGLRTSAKPPQEELAYLTQGLSPL